MGLAVLQEGYALAFRLPFAVQRYPGDAVRNAGGIFRGDFITDFHMSVAQTVTTPDPGNAGIEMQSAGPNLKPRPAAAVRVGRLGIDVRRQSRV
jgi:hypothetical protein